MIALFSVCPPWDGVGYHSNHSRGESNLISYISGQIFIPPQKLRSKTLSINFSLQSENQREVEQTTVENVVESKSMLCLIVYLVWHQTLDSCFFQSEKNICSCFWFSFLCVCVCRLKSLGEGCKVWSSSAPNLGKSPKHAPMTAGFSSLNEMGEFSFLFKMFPSSSYWWKLQFNVSNLLNRGVLWVWGVPGVPAALRDQQ